MVEGVGYGGCAVWFRFSGRGGTPSELVGLWVHPERAFAGQQEPAPFVVCRTVSRYRATSLMRPPPPNDPTVGLCLGPYVIPLGGRLFLVSEVTL